MPDKIPLGYVELDNGTKAITAMNDLFLNHMFMNPKNWETLRDSVNIILEEYRQSNPDTSITLVVGKVVVETQYKYLLNIENATRDQDIKMTAEAELVFIEFQNRAKTTPPVEIRAVEYFGLAIGHSKGKTANQIWLMAEDLESVLHDKAFARYILRDEVTGELHPGDSGILYVSLPKLAQNKSPAGELAAFLLGLITEPKDEKIKAIVNNFNTSFDAFKSDKEVLNMLSLKERAKNEGRDEAVHEMYELIKKGFTPEDAMEMVMNKNVQKEAV